MPNIINHQVEDIVYVELTHGHERQVELCFAWIDGLLFLPASLLDDDPADAVAMVLGSDTDIYSRGSLNYFVWTEWLKEQRPELAELLENIREVAEPFNRKFSGNPCGVCLKGQHDKAENCAGKR